MSTIMAFSVVIFSLLMVYHIKLLSLSFTVDAIQTISLLHQMYHTYCLVKNRDLILMNINNQLSLFSTSQHYTRIAKEGQDYDPYTTMLAPKKQNK